MSKLKYCISILLAPVFVSLSACGDNDSDSEESSYVYEMPTSTGDGWEVAHIDEVSVDEIKISQMMDVIKDNTYVNIDAFLLARNGRLAVDELLKDSLREHDSFIGNTDLNVHSMQSTTKSFVSALTGIAIDMGFISSVDEKFYDFFPEYNDIQSWDERKAAMTLENVLNMRHGWDYEEWGVPQSSDDNALFYLYRNHTDLVRGLLDFPMAHQPGTNYAYSTIASHAIGAAVTNRVGMPIDEFANLVLFEPMEINSHIWAYSSVGRAHTGGGLWLGHRDMLKFGQLYLNKGTWNGKRIISKDWVEQTFQRRVSFNFGYSDGYSYQWWLKDYSLNGEIIQTYFTAGNGGQFIYIIPAKNAVVAFTGGNYDRPNTYQPDKLMERFVLPALR